MNNLIYISAHFVPIEDDTGDIVDGAWVCSDACHRNYCQDNDLPYGGWFGCQEKEHDLSHGPALCEQCGGDL